MVKNGPYLKLLRYINNYTNLVKIYFVKNIDHTPLSKSVGGIYVAITPY